MTSFHSTVYSTVGRPFPRVSPIDEPFWSACRSHVLAIQRCDGCSAFIHPPLPRCSTCLSEDLHFEALSGRATVLTYTVNHHVWRPDWTEPYIVCLAEPDDAAGVRVIGEMFDCSPAEMRIGMPVRVAFIEANHGFPVPAFRPAKAGG